MKGALIIIEGAWGHFKRPETNNNPLTHDFITKTALIGLIGSVLGISRQRMKPLFPQLSEDLVYGVQALNEIRKESWAFTLRKAVNQLDKAPKHMEFLRNPKFLVALGLKDERSLEIWTEFLEKIKSEEALFTPVLGIHNCPANLSLQQVGMFERQDGIFTTQGFAKKTYKPQLDVMKKFRIGFDKIPTYQNDDFWNLPERCVEVIYPTNGESITVEGEYFTFTDGSAWVLV
jgi:CRISPR-associated protein Cas5 subtype I-B